MMQICPQNEYYFMRNEIINTVFNVDIYNFEKLAIEVFNFQYQENSIYRSYCDLLNIKVSEIQNIIDIPFLPIQFFKSHQVIVNKCNPEIIFESSKTTGSISSKHFVSDISLYENSFHKCIELFYPDIKNYCILGLLPSYLERSNSSLVYMVDKLIKNSNQHNSGFYLNEFQALANQIISNEKENIPTLLIGVSYALIDFAHQHPMQLNHTIIMETGGMKGRKEEIGKQEMHSILTTAFRIKHIHSEYGMTELLSQAYSFNDGIFNCPPWMKILLRSEDDPLEVTLPSLTNETYEIGGLNVIDLANINSCSFIATEDYCKLYLDGSFELLGRIKNSDIRGCGLMYL
jgi:hypothetical protein